jgi:hypothetical protein
MWFARLLGLLTVLYSIVVLIRPRILVTPAGLVPRADQIPVSVKALARGVGARDAAVGLAMMFAPMTVPLAWVLAIRIACDLSDAAVFGVLVPDRSAKLKTIGVAVGWGVLNGLALWAVVT